MRRYLITFALTLGLTACGESPPVAVAPVPTQQHFEPQSSSGGPDHQNSTADRPRHATFALQRRARLFDRPGGKVLHVLGVQTEFGSQTILGVLRRRGNWLKVAASQLPNDERGWVRAGNGVLGGTDYEIRVDRSKIRAVLRRDGKKVIAFPVAVGRPGNETPLGRYAVTDKLAPTDGTSPYGCCALALTGHQTKLEPGWPGGDRLAIHGTPAVETIGTAASLGCMRAPEKALRKLMRRVPLGAPVFVRA